MLKHLIEKRKALLDKVEALLNKAASETRSLSAAEETQRAADMSSIKDLDTQIKAAQDAIEARAAQDALETRGSPAAPRALAGDIHAGPSVREQRDLDGYSLIRAFGALLDGRPLDGIEKEMHQEAEKELRDANAPRGNGNFLVPQLIMNRSRVAGMVNRDLTAGTANQGGNLVQTNVQSIIERLQADMPLIGLGATVFGGLQGNLSFPTFTADDQAAIKTEFAAANESSPTFTSASMSPRRVPAFVEVSRQLLNQTGSSGVEGKLRSDLTYQIRKVMETIAYNGSGSGEPYGILNTVGVGSVAGGTNGLAPSWDHIIDLESAVANVDAAAGSLGYLTNTKVRGKLKKTPIASNTAATMIWDRQNKEAPLNDYRVGVSTLMPSTLTKGTSSGVCSGIVFGNFADAYIGQWGGIEVLVNPYSRDTEGLIRINLWTFFDFLVGRPASFSVMKDALTT
jgi:HK97 family phage major capsid protein